MSTFLKKAGLMFTPRIPMAPQRGTLGGSGRWGEGDFGAGIAESIT